MSIQNQKHADVENRNYISIVVFFLILLVVGWGCAGTHKTTKTETTITSPYETEHNTSMAGQQNREVVEKTETTITTDTDTKHRGVVGTTFHAIGYIISLPFIIIGGVFRTLFGG